MAAASFAQSGALPKVIRALAEGDFGEVAGRFAAAGFTVGRPA
jgi:succinylglutamate desuccinylase